MKKNKGVTLTSLAVVILILFILSSVTIQVGIRVYNEAMVENYVSKLKVIQAKVDNIAEETDDVSSYGFTSLTDAQGADPEGFQIFISIIQEPSKYNIVEGTSWNSAVDGVIGNYYYFSPQDLEDKLGLKNQDMTVAINFKTRNVIAKNSLKLDGEFYHRQYDIERGSQLMGNTKETNITYPEKLTVNINTTISDSYLKNINNISNNSISITDIQVKNSSNAIVNQNLNGYDIYTVTYNVKDENGSSQAVIQTFTTKPTSSKTLTNKLQNAGFESELSNYYNGTPQRSSTIKRTGNYSMFFNCLSSQAFVRFNYGNINAKNNKVYIRAYARTDDLSLNPGIYVYEIETNQEWAATASRGLYWMENTAYNTWEMYSLLTEPTDKNYEYFMLQISQANLDGTGDVYWDDLMALVIDDSWEVVPTKAWLDQMIPDIIGTQTISW